MLPWFSLDPAWAFLIYWLIAPVRVNAAFAAFNLPWLVGILGLVFIPWTTLMYVLIFPLNGYDWIWLGLWRHGRCRQLHGRLPQTPGGPGLSENDPLANY